MAILSYTMHAKQNSHNLKYYVNCGIIISELFCKFPEFKFKKGKESVEKNSFHLNTGILQTNSEHILTISEKRKEE